MRRTLPGVDLTLGAAANRVRALYARCPEPRPDIAGEAWHALGAALDAHCGAGDRHLALAAIAAWEDRTTTVLVRARAHALLAGPDRQEPRRCA
jgi:hypothetical protein